MGNGAGVRGTARVYPERIGCENRHSSCQTRSRKSISDLSASILGVLQRRGQRLLDRAERSSSEAGIVRAECAELDGESAMERRSARCAACCHQTLSRPRTRTDHFAQGPSPAVLPPSYLRGVNTAEAARNTRYVLSSSKPLAFPDLSAAPRASGNAGVTSFARWLLAALSTPARSAADRKSDSGRWRRQRFADRATRWGLRFLSQKICVVTLPASVWR